MPQHPEVQLLAASVLEQWLHTAVAQVQVLNDPRYAQDPRSVLDSRCVVVPSCLAQMLMLCRWCLAAVPLLSSC